MEEGIGLLGGVKHYLEYQAHAHSNSATVGCSVCPPTSPLEDDPPSRTVALDVIKSWIDQRPLRVS